MNIPKRLFNPVLKKAYSSTAASLIMVGALLSAPQVSATDLVMSPAGCQAPFLSQAGPMRWHEWYLGNPATNIATFVICPLTFDPNVVTFPAAGFTNVFVDGASQSGASSQTPLCFFSAAAFNNQNLDGFVTIPGGDRTFIQPLGTNQSFPLWNAFTAVNNDAITLATGQANPVNRNHAIFCQLPPGYALSLLSFTQ